MRRFGFGTRDISFLFAEAALSSQNGLAHPLPKVGANQDCVVRLIGGTAESLTCLEVKRGIVAAAIASLGIPKHEAEEYERAIGVAKLLICVRSFSPAFDELAMDALLISGAHRIIAVPRFNPTPCRTTSNDLSWSEMTPFYEARLVC